MKGSAALLALLALVGCIEPAPPRSLTFDQFVADLGLALCSSCLGGWYFGLRDFSSAKNCARAEGPGLRQQFRTLVDQGDVAFDGAAAARCNDWVAGQRDACVSRHPWFWSAFDSPCLAVLVGERKVGQPCLSDAQCSTRLCSADGPCGTPRCQPVRKEGAPCAEFDGCGARMHCGLDGQCHAYHRPGKGQACDLPWECQPGLSCANGKCRPLAGPQERCRQWDYGWYPACGPGLACTNASDGEYRCAVLGALGGDCSTFEGCGEGLVCDDGVCQMLAKDGQPCSPSRVNCTGDDRACQLDASGVVRCLPLPDVGAACAPESAVVPDGNRCQLDLYCDPATATCRKQFGRGQPCAGQNECSAGTSCHDQVCKDGLAMGDPCHPQAHWHCPTGAWCKQGVCTPLVGAGGDCSESASACAAGTFCDNGKCRMAGGLHATCNADKECALGLKCTGLKCEVDPCAGQP
ncbi:MAG: hypothetical protein FJ100_08480 [Deltaproteobacteria bacterium]|nr:hypothetical protein [Deltaproteobacteria bacterium]